MRFSVLCTNYNKEPYIEECLRSVLTQDFDDYEFIVIDDASTDKSPDIIKSFLAQYPAKIKFIQNEVNIGMAAGYNKAMEIASGEIICLIDSDDFWFQGKLKHVDEYFRFHKNCVLHQHPLQIYNFSEATPDYYRPFLLSGNLMEYIRETKNIPLYVATTGLSFRTDIVRKLLPIPVEFAKNGEAFLTRTAICYGEVGVTYIVMGGYRKTDTNIVFGNSSYDTYSYIENILKPALNSFYKKNGFDLYFPPHIPNTAKSRSVVRRAYHAVKRIINK